MKPRVFISSTYYDLKHVRERLERFIENYYFDPVLFESDTVTFEPNKSLDISCYNEVKLCHMMILIVGGRYGSAISGDDTDEKKDFYNKEYISITRKEFETAIKLNVPIFVFIEKNVYAEYHTYSKNQDIFEGNNPIEFSFAHADDINVFRFINILKSIAIKTFEKIEDIEHYLGNQFAGMLYLYLQNLRDEKQDEKILDSVSELKNISKRMNEMLVAVGKNVIKGSSFDDVIFNQNKILVEFFVEQFCDNITFRSDSDIPLSVSREVFEILKQTILSKENILNVAKEKDFQKMWSNLGTIESKFKSDLLFLDSRLQIDSFNYYKIFKNYAHKILPILDSDVRLQEYLDTKLFASLELEITGLPF